MFFLVRSVLIVVGALFGFSSLSACHPQEDEERAQEASDKRMRQAKVADAVRAMLELSGKIRQKEAEIAAHDAMEPRLDTSDYDATKAYIQRSSVLSLDLQVLRDEYNAAAASIECHYPGSIQSYGSDGTKLAELPCHR